MKKRIVGIIVLVLLTMLGVLFWVQLSYYNKVLSIRNSQTIQLARNALSDLTQDIEIRELTRYLKQELRLQRHREAVNPRLQHLFSQLSINPSTLDSIEARMEASTYRHRADAPGARDRHTEQDTAIFKALEQEVDEGILESFFFRRRELDALILRSLYESYNPDSIPRLLNTHYIKRRMRVLLDEKGVADPFHLKLFDADGRIVYSYTQPGMLRPEITASNTISESLFSRSDSSSARTPYISLTLDLSPTRLELTHFALPGIISTLVVSLLGVFAITLLIRQLSFQRTKNSFINNMTHEFKTPVSSINLATQAMRSPEGISSPERRGQLLSIIEIETKRLRFLIDKVLEFSLLDGRTQPYALKLLDLNEVLLNVAEIAAMHAESKGGNLTLELEAENTWVKANTMHLTNALFNLIDNAVKYSKNDAPLYLSISTQTLDSQYLLLTVADNGIGIPKGSHKKVFERYYRVPTGHIHEVRGFGLGLSYVRSVIRNMGGQISAESNPGGGTRIIIKLPTQSEDL